MTLRHALSALLTSLLLVGCGGGSGNTAANDPTTPPEPAEQASSATTTSPEPEPGTALAKFEGHSGIWRGTTATNRAVTAFVQSSDTESVYWLLYSQPNSASIDGVIQGRGSVDGRSIVASRSTDYNFTTDETLTGTARAALSDAGALEWRYLATSAIPKLIATDYTSLDSTATIEEIAGSYTGELAQRRTRETATIVISEQRRISITSSSGCRGGGSVNPDSRHNVFWISITLGESCQNRGSSLGIAFWDPKTAQFYMATHYDIDFGTGGTVFVGNM